MQEIGKHISELLFDHDCVIVPALGGFLASNQPSRVLLPNQIIFPPYRRIAFNVYLKQNDGLLANHLAETENIPYPDATQLIDSFSAGCFDILDSGKKVNIPEVGTLFYDKEKNIQFEAFRNFNHLKESFGMEAVHFLPVKREVKNEKAKPPAEKIIRPSLPAEKVISSNAFLRKGSRYLGAIAVVSALTWFSLNLYFIAPKKYESTSLNPFDTQDIVLTQTDSVRNSPSVIQKAETLFSETVTVASVPVENTQEIDNKGTNQTVEKKSNEQKKEEVIASTILPLPQTPKSISESSNSQNHYIIAGVFKIKENALSMLVNLQKLGFSNARIIEANDRNYVAYDGFTESSDAKALADSLRKNNLEGWIWKY